MGKIIEVKFISDNIITDQEKLPYVRYINRILSGLKEDIIFNKGYIKVIAKKGSVTMSFTSTNDHLNKHVNARLFNAPPFSD